MAGCQLTVTGKGNIERVGHMLTQVKNNYKIIGNQIVDSNSELYYDELMNVLQTQKFKPLNPEYKKQKGLLGLDTRILIATSEYISNIQIRRVNNYKGLTARHVGVDSNKRHSKSKLTMSDLAIIHEYGTSDGKIPARPHYSKAWESVLPKIRRNTLDIARDMVR